MGVITQRSIALAAHFVSRSSLKSSSMLFWGYRCTIKGESCAFWSTSEFGVSLLVPKSPCMSVNGASTLGNDVSGGINTPIAKWDFPRFVWFINYYVERYDFRRFL